MKKNIMKEMKLKMNLKQDLESVKNKNFIEKNEI